MKRRSPLTIDLAERPERFQVEKGGDALEQIQAKLGGNRPGASRRERKPDLCSVCLQALQRVRGDELTPVDARGCQRCRLCVFLQGFGGLILCWSRSASMAAIRSFKSDMLIWWESI